MTPRPMSSRIGCACWALLVLIFTPIASASRLPILVYRTSQGLPRNTVTCMAPAPNGAMWFCSSEGLVRFDGRNFRIFGPEHGLPSQSITLIQQARTGGYWVITDRGVCRIAAGARVGDPCRPIAGSEAEDWRYGGNVLETAAGDTWIASARRVLRLDTARFAIADKVFASPNWARVISIAEGDAGSLLIGTEDALFTWCPGGEMRNLTAGMKGMGIADIVRLPSGDYWLATSHGLFRLRFVGTARTPELRGDWVPYPEYPRQFLLRKDGTLWAVSVGKVVELAVDSAGDARIARRITAADGLPTAILSGIAEDSSGGVWVSTEGDGVARIDDTGFVQYAAADGLGNGRIAALFETVAGRLMAAITFDGGHDLFAWADGRFRPVELPSPRDQLHSSTGNQITLQARNGEWWFATDYGVLRFAPATVETLRRARLIRHYRAAEGGLCDYAVHVFEDSGGNIWASCSGLHPGPARFDRATDSFHPFGADEGWPAGTVAGVFGESAPGTLWIATVDGVVRFRRGRFETLRLGDAVPKIAVRYVFVDRTRRVWLATTGYGLYRCDESEAEHPKWQHYGLQEGLSSVYLRTVVQDRDGYIYACSVRGVDRIDPNTPPALRRIHHFDQNDGLPDAEQEAALTARDGRVWFGTMRGLAAFQPRPAPPSSPPDVYFTRVLIRGDEAPLEWNGTRSAALRLSSDRNQVQIEFAGGDARPSADLHFQYRLSGVQEEWSEPSRDLRVNYPALPAGRLRFEVRAVNAEGLVSHAPATLDLDVAAPVWRRWWFLSLAAAVAAALSVAAYRYRVNQLLAMERLRTRIATDLHDDIGANLSQIAILTEVARRDPARTSLEVISDIARETVEQMNDIVWAVNPRHDRFEAMLHRMRRYAGETLGGAGIDLAFENAGLPSEFTIPIHVRRPLYLAFKEAINNAARHSQADRVTVHFDVTAGALQIVIADNGRGFDLNARRDGEGVNSIDQRMREHHGAARWDTAPGDGTRLTITLPLKRGRSRIN